MENIFNSFKDTNKLAGFRLEKLHEEYEIDLFDDFIPFFDKHVIDHELGGFMCNTDRDGKNITTNKAAWYEGRGIWVYSFLYNNLAKEQKYLDIAARSVEFILKNKPSGNNVWPSSFNREGKAFDKQHFPFTGDIIYGDLFIANGLSEYSRAICDNKYWDTAKDILQKCIKIYDDPEYPFHVDYGPKVPPMKGERVLGHWMVILRIASQMLEKKSDPDIENIAARCVDAIMNYHYNPEFGLLNEVLNHDMSRPENEFAQFVYTGHAIEILWMVAYEAVRIKDKRLFNLAADRFKRHVEIAWDDTYGGIFNGLYNVNKNIWTPGKSLWAQEEVLVGTMLIIEHSGAQWAKDWFAKMYTYVKEKYPLKHYGFSLWILFADRKVTFERHADRVGNFHHPRHLMLNLLSIKRMIKRRGKTS
ncbi:AGE family epimerase/isomerase [candidate division KSB1 bacterium]